MFWSTADIADAVCQGLKRCAAERDAEQAIYGLDSLDELGLHPVIQEALRGAGMGVWPEQTYPSERRRARKSEGRRCDLVLTPPPQALPLRDPGAARTLFDQQPAVDLADAYWLEIKTVAQFEQGGPFGRYSAEMLSPVAGDVKKLWSDGTIRYGGLLLVLFTADAAVAEHDLAAWHRRCLERGYPVRVPAKRGFPITDRIGNGWCSAAVFAVREM